MIVINGFCQAIRRLISPIPSGHYALPALKVSRGCGNPHALGHEPEFCEGFLSHFWRLKCLLVGAALHVVWLWSAAASGAPANLQ